MLRSKHSRFHFLAGAALAAFGQFVSGCGGTPNQFSMASQSQSFGQTIVFNNKVDILIVESTTSSMATKQQQLSQGFAPMINYLTAAGFDYHIAVTTMDMSSAGAQGAFVGSPKVLTSATPNVAQAFVSNVSQGNGGSDLPRGLQAMQTALGTSMLNGVNAGFWRSDALLALVFLTDQDDASSGTAQSYLTWLNQIKPPFANGSPSWVANSIVVQSLTGQCATFNQYASPGLKYITLSTASGGTVESVCNGDLVEASSDIRASIISVLTQYHLASDATVSSIKVFINGTAISEDPVNGWTYSSAGYTLTFHGASIPPANGDVQVSYQPATVAH